MKRPAIITTPIPTSDEIARRLGMSKKRQREIQEIVQNGLKREARREKAEKTKHPPTTPRPTAANEAA